MYKLFLMGITTPLNTIIQPMYIKTKQIKPKGNNLAIAPQAKLEIKAYPLSEQFTNWQTMNVVRVSNERTKNKEGVSSLDGYQKLLKEVSKAYGFDLTHCRPNCNNPILYKCHRSGSNKS